MLGLTKWIGAPLLAGALMFTADAPSAEAQGFSLQIGRFGISSGHYGYRNAPRTYGRHHSYYGGHRGHHGHHGHRGHHPRRPHYDYHPPSLVPHGNHFDIVPGHWDYHHGRHGGRRGHGHH